MTLRLALLTQTVICGRGGIAICGCCRVCRIWGRWVSILLLLVGGKTGAVLEFVLKLKTALSLYYSSELG